LENYECWLTKFITYLEITRTEIFLREEVIHCLLIFILARATISIIAFQFRGLVFISYFIKWEKHLLILLRRIESTTNILNT